MNDHAELSAQLAQLQRSHKRMKLALGGLVLTAAAGLLAGAAAYGPARFTELDVERINLREADGTLRMVIANRERFPGLYLHNTEHPHDRGGDKSGMLFFNDEGTENGGLIYNGYQKADGTVSSGLSLTFDRYQQDQQVQLLGVDQGGRSFVGLMFNDVADGVARPVLSDADKAANQAGNYAVTPRVFLGKSGSQNASLVLNDGDGKPRLQLEVTPDGSASVVFLDASGKEVHRISPPQNPGQSLRFPHVFTSVDTSAPRRPVAVI